MIEIAALIMATSRRYFAAILWCRAAWTLGFSRRRARFCSFGIQAVNACRATFRRTVWEQDEIPAIRLNAPRGIAGIFILGAGAPSVSLANTPANSFSFHRITPVECLGVLAHGVALSDFRYREILLREHKRHPSAPADHQVLAVADEDIHRRVLRLIVDRKPAVFPWRAAFRRPPVPDAFADWLWSSGITHRLPCPPACSGRDTTLDC